MSQQRDKEKVQPNSLCAAVGHVLPWGRASDSGPEPRQHAHRNYLLQVIENKQGGERASVLSQLHQQEGWGWGRDQYWTNENLF